MEFLNPPDVKFRTQRICTMGKQKGEPPFQLRKTRLRKTKTAPAVQPPPAKSTNWRHKLKAENPTKYAEVLKKSAEYNKLQRLEMSLAAHILNKRNISKEEREKAEKYVERKQKYNKGTAMRMKKLRLKKKIEESKVQKKMKQNLPVTRTQQIEQKQKRAAEAKYRREKRAALSKEERERHNANRRKKYQQKVQQQRYLRQEANLLKERKKELKEEEMRLKALREALEEKEKDIKSKMSAFGADKRTPEARRKSLERAKAKMPKEPEKYVTTLVDLFEKVSPWKKMALEKRGIGLQGSEKDVQHVLVATIANEMKSIRLSRKKKSTKCHTTYVDRWKQDVLFTGKPSIAPLSLQDCNASDDNCSEEQTKLDEGHIGEANLPHDKHVTCGEDESFDYRYGSSRRGSSSSHGLPEHKTGDDSAQSHIGALDFVDVRVTSAGRRAKSNQLHVAQVASVLPVSRT